MNTLLNISTQSIFRITFQATVILALFMYVNTQQTYASHAMGMDLSYKCMGASDYEITLNFYYDCASSENPPTNALINVQSNSCGILMPDIYLPQVTGSNVEVSPLCDLYLAADSSSCNGGTLPGVKRFKYQGIISLPETCNDWKVNFTECCRSSTIINILAPDEYNLHVEAIINNTNGLCNNSPEFANLPVPFYCMVPSIFSQAYEEEDGDELVFSSITPLDNINTNIAYQTGFSAAQPLSTILYDFNPSNGTITFTPDAQQVSVVTILVEEFRDGEFVGSTMRDVEVIVLDCNNNQVTINEDNNVYQTCIGQFVTIDIVAEDINPADDIILTSNLSNFSGATLEEIAGTTNPLTTTFEWLPSPLDTGFHTLIVSASDNACPITSNYVYTFDIEVYLNPDAGEDITYCNEPIQLQMSGGDDFSWSPTEGLNLIEPNGSVVAFSPATTTTYTVTNQCGGTDEITVNVTTDFNLSTSPNASICPNDSLIIEAITDDTNYTYDWSPSNTLSDSNIATPFAKPLETTTYTVTVTSLATGCSQIANTTVAIDGTLVDLELYAINDSICTNETTEIVAAPIQLQPCGINTAGCVGTGRITTVGAGPDGGSEDGPTPYNGSWEDARIQLLYTRADLLNAGVIPGTITALGFKVNAKYSNEPYHNFTIKIGCTDNVTIANFETGLSTVYNNAAYNTLAGWNMHQLDNAYDWDGHSNLIVEICFDNDAWLYKDEVAYVPTLGNTVVSAYDHGTTGCTLSEPNPSNKRPLIRMDVCGTAPTTPLAITWSPTDGLSDPSILNPIATPSSTTTYTVTIDDNGCTVTDMLTITVKESRPLSTIPEHTICEYEDLLLSVEGFNSTDTPSYDWQPSSGLNCTNCPTPLFSTSAGVYNYEVLVTEANGCTSLLQTTVNVQAAPSINAGEDQIVKKGEIVNLNATGDFTSIQWTPAEGLDDAAIAMPSASITSTTTYTALASNLAGCTASDEVTLTYRGCDTGLQVPNAFSPNGDGFNDTYRINQQGFDEFNLLRIYNRWGKLVFETTESNFEWDGTFKGESLTMGVYPFFIKYVCDGKEEMIRGNITVIR